jgi:hypothetical protein
METKNVFGIGLYCLYFEPDTWYQYFLGWSYLVRKSTILDLDLSMQKKMSFFFTNGLEGFPSTQLGWQEPLPASRLVPPSLKAHLVFLETT